MQEITQIYFNLIKIHPIILNNTPSRSYTVLPSEKYHYEPNAKIVKLPRKLDTDLSENIDNNEHIQEHSDRDHYPHLNLNALSKQTLQ